MNTKQGILSIDKFANPNKYVGKLKDNIVFRSSWEYSFMYFCDRNDNILEWSSEEVVIKYQLKGRWHRYFPDFYIKYKTPRGIKEALIEIKPYHETVKPVLKESMTTKRKKDIVETYAKNQAKWDSTRNWCLKEKKKGRNISFYIITEKDILLVPDEKIKDDMRNKGFVI